MNQKHPLVLLAASAIIILAAVFRFWGVNWDTNQHLHPDERFLTMVVSGLSWPKTIADYFDTDRSLLNPHNTGNQFFVYGTFPVIFTKWVSESVGMGDYNGVTIVGRVLSGIFDLGTVMLVFLIGKQISTNQLINKSTNQQTKKARIGLLDYLKLDNWMIPLVAMFFYATLVLPIQLSHFFAVDTYLTFFITLTFYFLTILIRNSEFGIRNSILIGVAFGFAIGCKITSLLFLPIIGLAFLFVAIKRRAFFPFLAHGLLFIISLYFAVRVAQPYLFAGDTFLSFTLNPKLIENWRQLKSFDDASGGFPPAVQWITTKPYIFPLKNYLFWGMGLPLGIISIVSVIYIAYLFALTLQRLLKTRKLGLPASRSYILLLMLLWILLLFGYQGSQFVKALRYFYPLYPFMALISAYTISLDTTLRHKRYNASLLAVLCCLALIPPIAFTGVYARPHTRVAASEWIYWHIPPGSVISAEHWDDFLPLSLPAPGKISQLYRPLEFPLYWPDNAHKWDVMVKNLYDVDYIILTSNRLYGSLLTVPAKYPVTDRYYRALFSGALGFEKVAEFTSRPTIPIPFVSLCLTPPFARYGIIAHKSQDCETRGISFVDDYADETFTVYDHPKVIVFKKIKPVNYKELLVIPKE